MSKTEYWRCQNDNCGFFKARKKKSPWNNPQKKSLEGARWLMAWGNIPEGSDAWFACFCPHCKWRLSRGETIKDDDSISKDEELRSQLDKIPNNPISLFRGLKRKDADA